MALRWYLARARPRGEYAARDQLRSLDVDVFMPTVLTPQPRPGREDAPLYPGYLFLRLDRDEDHADRLRMIPQFAGFVTFGGIAPPVDDHVIEGIAGQVDAVNATGGLWRRPAHGDRVVVTLGGTEIPAEVVDHNASPRARVRVLLEFLGRQVPAELSGGTAARAGFQSPDFVPAPKAARRTRGGRRWIRGYGARATVPAS